MSFFSKRHKDKHNDKAAKNQDAAAPAPPMNFGQQLQPGASPSPPQPGMAPSASFDRLPTSHSAQFGGPQPPSSMGGPSAGAFQDANGGRGGEMSREQLAHQQMMLEQRKVSGGLQQSPQQQLGNQQVRKPVSALPGPPPAPSSGSSEIQFPWCVCPSACARRRLSHRPY